MNRPIPTRRRYPRAWVVFSIIVVACLMGALVGCDSPAATNTGNSWTPSVWTDSETGCQYLSPRDGKAITPRMGRDGKQVCLMGAKAGGVL